MKSFTIEQMAEKLKNKKLFGFYSQKEREYRANKYKKGFHSFLFLTHDEKLVRITEVLEEGEVSQWDDAVALGPVAEFYRAERDPT